QRRCWVCFLSVARGVPTSRLFPYTALFRSSAGFGAKSFGGGGGAAVAACAGAVGGGAGVSITVVCVSVTTVATFGAGGGTGAGAEATVRLGRLAQAPTNAKASRVTRTALGRSHARMVSLRLAITTAPPLDSGPP